MEALELTEDESFDFDVFRMSAFQQDANGFAYTDLTSVTSVKYSCAELLAAIMSSVRLFRRLGDGKLGSSEFDGVYFDGVHRGLNLVPAHTCGL